eukprot:4717179-Amphidinium_carterae.1
MDSCSYLLLVSFPFQPSWHLVSGHVGAKSGEVLCSAGEFIMPTMVRCFWQTVKLLPSCST